MQSSAALNSANFSYTGHLEGKSTATYIFGIGGMTKRTLVDDARENMLSKNPLKSNQALANLTVNWKRSYILGFVYSTLSCVVTADVVDFYKGN